MPFPSSSTLLLGTLLILVLVMLVALVTTTVSHESFEATPTTSLAAAEKADQQEVTSTDKSMKKTIGDVLRIAPQLPIAKSVQKSLQSPHTIQSPDKPSTYSARPMPVTSRGCFTYTVTKDDVDKAQAQATYDDSLSQYSDAIEQQYYQKQSKAPQGNTPRQVLCSMLKARFGQERSGADGTAGTPPLTPILTDPRDPSATMPYCDAPIQLNPANTLSGTTNNAYHTQVAEGDQVNICPPQSFGSKTVCVYKQTTPTGTPYTCSEMMDDTLQNHHYPTDTTVTMLPPLPTCPTVPGTGTVSNTMNTPMKCPAGGLQAKTTSNLFLVCGSPQPTSLSPSTTCDDSGNAQQGDNCSPTQNCACACHKDTSCRYFQPTETGCLSYGSFFDPLSNIGENSTESHVYAVNTVSPFQSPGVLRLPYHRSTLASSSSGSSYSSCNTVPARFQSESLLHKIPCGDCTRLGSVGGCSEGSCLPPLVDPSSADPVALSLANSPERCRELMDNALTQSGWSYDINPTTAEDYARNHKRNDALSCLCSGGDPTACTDLTSHPFPTSSSQPPAQPASSPASSPASPAPSTSPPAPPASPPPSQEDSATCKQRLTTEFGTVITDPTLLKTFVECGCDMNSDGCRQLKELTEGTPSPAAVPSPA